MSSIITPEMYKRAFTLNHSRLVKKLTSHELVEGTFSKSLITLSEKQEIEAENIESSQIGKLLGILHRRYVGDREIFIKLFDVLKAINEEEGGYIDHVISSLQESLDPRSDSPVPSSNRILNEEDRAKLINNEDVIVGTLDVEKILPDLISEEVISFEESHFIENEKDFQKRAKLFLDILKTRNSNVYHKFLNILSETEVYEQLVSSLSNPTAKHYPSVDIEEVLKRGHVPPPPHNYIERPELIKAIRKQLRKLKDEDSWVLVSGLPGFGKTVLAAESVRNLSLLSEVFIGGVYWLNVGRMTSDSGEIDTAAQLEKIQNFIARMDPEKYCPNNLESCTDYLQVVMNNHYPQSLLILDDVWEYETAQVFDIRCRTLVTSRNSDIAGRIHTNRIYKVNVMEGFTAEEGRMILAKSTGRPVNELPPAANQIIRLCHGSPIALDIIGAMLKKNSANSRWLAVVDKLTKQHPGTLPRKGGAGTPNMGRRGSEVKRGRMKETLNTSIMLSEESLPQDVKELFHQLVVFEPDTLITTEALTILWDMEDEFAADNSMADIISWSLAQQAVNKTQKEENLSYIIHDMILSYLQDTVPDCQKLLYQQKFVESYEMKCEGNFAHLEPDSYIHHKLLYHVNAAAKYELLGRLLTDLPWLASCCIHWDSNSLLEAYKKYSNSIPSQFADDVNDFQLFLSYNLDKLSRDKITLQKVIQLALNSSSEKLTKQAMEAMHEYKDDMWLIWCNKTSINRPNAFLQLQPHRFKEIKYCQYYQNGSMILSCSTIEAKIWEASTGKVLESFGNHDNTITHCVISECGDLIVTSSEDCTCNVWEVHPKKLLLTFKGHDYGVQCCDLSPDNDLVVSGDIESCVKVWSVSTGIVRSSWIHSDGGVTWSAFTPNGSSVVISDQASVLKLYDLKGVTLSVFPIISYSPHSPGNIYDLSWSRGPSRTSSTGSNTFSFTIRQCVCSRDGSLLAAAVADCTAKVWSMTTQNCLHSFRHATEVLCVDFSPNAKLLATGSASGMVKVWSLAEDCPMFDLLLHYDWVTCVKFSPEASNILSSYSDGSIKLIQNQQRERSWKIYRRRFAVCFQQDGDEYIPLIVCYDQVESKLEICQGLNGDMIRSLSTIPNHKPRSWDISPDGTMIVIGYDRGIIQLLATTDKELWKIEEAHSDKVLHCYFSPDGSRIVSCGGDKDCTHKVWSVAEGKMLSWQPDCQDYWIKPCMFYNDSRRLASTALGSVLVWDTDTGEKLFICEGISNHLDESILCVNISGDYKRLIASASNGRIAVWDADNGKPLFNGSYTSPNGNSQARFCSLNWDGSVAAVGHDDSVLKIYNVESGHERVCPSTGLTAAWMIATQFSPDNRQILTLSDSIQWWSVADGTVMKQFLLNSTFGKYIHFSPDFKLFITVDNTGILYILKTLRV